MVLGQIVTTNEPEALIHRLYNIDGDGFTVELDEEKGNTGGHGPEDVHYVAIEGGTGSFTSFSGVPFAVAATGNTVNEIDEIIAGNQQLHRAFSAECNRKAEEGAGEHVHI